jgi:hypothetical protein
MAVLYRLFENKMTTSMESKFLPRTLIRGRITEDRVMEIISYSSSITPGDIQSVLHELKNVIRRAMLDGNIIDLGFITFKPSVKGRCADAAAGFVKGSSSVAVNAKLKGAFLAEFESQWQIELAKDPAYHPKILTVYNYRTGTADGTENKAGDLIKIKGSNLNFERSDPGQGVFLIPVNGDPEIRINNYADINAKNIVFVLSPNIPSIEYTIQIRCRSDQRGALATGDFRILNVN